MNADGPKKRETTIMWELQVLKALDLPCATEQDVKDVQEDQGVRNGNGDTGHYDIDTHHNDNLQLH